MSDNQEWTIGRLLTWTADYLKQHGADNPRLDAEVLLAHARNCERIMLYTAFSEPVSEEVRGTFRELVKRRASGIPVAYLVGRKEFFSLAFRVTPDVLIPRPETEHLVTAALDLLKSRPADASPARVLDIGTGSGAIAITLAVNYSSAKVTASDISEAALRIASENAKTHQVTDRIEFVLGDLWQPFPTDRQWDFIVSNPPYIAEQERSSLAREVADHEPGVALFGGHTGLELTQRLVEGAASHLVGGGTLVLEIHSQLVGEVTALFADKKLWTEVSVTKDLAQLPRVVSARRAN